MGIKKMEMMKEIKRKSRSTKRMGMKKMKLNKEIKRTSRLLLLTTE
uniref:Uncharacterized protein n=1 Tax=Cucumis melo TaxID=3656 RepID=A0A9I9ECH7_CUCME